MTELTSDHVDRNRDAWTTNAIEFAKTAEREWSGDPHWGVFLIPEVDVEMFPPDVDGWDVIELGCGTAYVSAWLARLGAKPIGIDVTPAQLETARRMQDQFDLYFPLIEGNAEKTDYPDASFDLVISEYGASIWCDPYRWIPEAYRLLRPGGLLRFLRNSTISMLCVPEEETAATDRLLRPQKDLTKLDWGTDGIEFALPHGNMIDLLHQTGFELEELRELYAPVGAANRYPYITVDWAQQWPAEEVWKARKPTQ